MKILLKFSKQKDPRHPIAAPKIFSLFFLRDIPMFSNHWENPAACGKATGTTIRWLFQATWSEFLWWWLGSNSVSRALASHLPRIAQCTHLYALDLPSACKPWVFSSPHCLVCHSEPSWPNKRHLCWGQNSHFYVQTPTLMTSIAQRRKEHSTRVERDSEEARSMGQGNRISTQKVGTRTRHCPCPIILKGYNFAVSGRSTCAFC